MNPILKEIRGARFIAIARRIPRALSLNAVEAVYKAGVRFLEFTFDPSDAGTFADTAGKVKDAIREFPSLRVGCGTVLSPDMVDCAADAGALYIISPHTSDAVVGRTLERGLLSIPGAFTPSEIVHAHELGAGLVKLFPVLPGEEARVRNIMTPLPHIPFIVTGGITPETIASMLSTGAAAAAAGASVFRPELLAAKDFASIGKLARLHLEKCGIPEEKR